MNTNFVFMSGTFRPLVSPQPRAPEVESLTERWFEGDARAGAELARLGERSRRKIRTDRVLEYQI